MNIFQTKMIWELLKVLGDNEIKTSDLDIAHIGADHIGDLVHIEKEFHKLDINECPQDVSHLYYLLQFNKSVMFLKNFNEPVEWKRTKPFDIIYNCHKSDQFFDQHSFFKNIHDHSGVGTLMMHTVPYWSTVETGMYNYHPAFFARLCGANQYSMVGSWIGTSTAEQFEKITIDYDYQGNKYNEKHNFFSYSAGEEAGWRRPAHIGVILRKDVDSEFQTPYADCVPDV